MSRNIYEETLDQIDRGELLPPAQTAPTQPNPYLDYLNEQEKQKALTAKQTTVGAEETSPDQAAEARALGRVLGLPTEVVQRNLPEMRRRQRIKEIEDAPEKLVEWLGKPENAAVAQDDLKSLGVLMDSWNIVQDVDRALRAGLLRGTVLGVTNLLKSTAEGTTPLPTTGVPALEIIPFATAINALLQTPKAQDVIGRTQRVAQAVTDAISPIEEDTPFVKGAILSGVESVGMMLPGTVMSVITRTPAVGLSIMGGTVGGESYAEAREKGLPREVALAYAGIMGGLEVLTEMIPIRWLIKDLETAKPFMQTLWRQMLSEAATEQVATFTQDATTQAFLYPEKTWGEFWRERPEAAYQTFIATAVAVGTMTAGTHTLNRLVKQAGETKLATRSPEQLASLLNDAAKGTQTSSVFLPLDTFTTYFQSKEESAAEWAEKLTGDPGAYERAVRDGATDLEVPIGNYVAFLGQSEHIEFFENEARLSNPSAPNARENEEFFKSTEPSETATEQQIEGEEADAETDTVRARVAEQLTATGLYTPQQVEIKALVADLMFRATAQRYGITPQQLFEESGFQIVGPQQARELIANAEAAQQAQFQQTQTPEFKAWFRESKAARDGKPVMLYHGTTEGTMGGGWTYLSNNPQFAEKFAYSDKPLPQVRDRVTTKFMSRDTGQSEVEGYTTAIPGLVITQMAEGGLSLTHQASGFAVVRGEDLEDIDNIVGRLQPLGIDWTVDKDALMKRVGPRLKKQINKAIKQGQGDAVASMFGYKPGAIGFGIGSQVMPTYASIQNPLDLRDLPARNVGREQLRKALEAKGIRLPDRAFMFGRRDLYQMLNTELREPLREAAIAAGYDGIVFNDYYDPQTRGESWIAFDTKQIKSAIGNRGTFSRESGDIRFQPARETLLYQAARQAQKKQGAQGFDAAPIEVLEDGRILISTRVPSGPKAEPQTRLLETRLSVFKQDPRLLRDLADTVRSHTLLTPEEALGTDEEVVERAVEIMVSNLRSLYDVYPAELRARARHWYDGAHNIALRLMRDYDLADVNQAAAVLASLSPQQDWFRNVELADRVIRHTQLLDETNPEVLHGDVKKWVSKYRKQTRQNISSARARAAKPDAKSAYTPEDEAKYRKKRLAVQRLVESQVGKHWRDLPTYVQAIMLREYDERSPDREYRVILPEGGYGELALNKDQKTPAKIGWTSYKIIENAIALTRSATAQEIHERLGKEHKVRSFYNNIVAPEDARFVTVDTHAVGAAYYRPFGSDSIEVRQALGGKAKSVSLGISGTSGLVAEAYFRLADRLNAEVLGVATITPREVQSITWEAVRGLFQPEQKRSGQLKVLVNNLWADHLDGRLTVEGLHEAVTAAVGGIARPAWEGTEPATGLGEDEGRLPGRDVQRAAGVSTRPGGGRAGAIGIAWQSAPDGGGVLLGPLGELARNQAQLAELAGRLDESDGGFSYRAESGEPREGYAVAIYPDRGLVFESAEAATVDALAEYVIGNADLLTQEGHHFGGWHDPETGKIYLDISVVVPTRREAQALARQHNQLAYFGFKEMRSFPTEEEIVDEEAGTVPSAEGDTDTGGARENLGAPDRAEADTGRAAPGAEGSVLSQDFDLSDKLGFTASSEEGPIVVGLLENANITTFIHELSHANLRLWDRLIKKLPAEGRTALQQKMVDDFNILLKWVGAESFETLTEAQHEQIANAFQTYVLEGKPPSEKLQGAMQKLRSWFLLTYRMLRLRKVEFTDEVRGVFDRMLATDEEIAAVEASLQPVFADQATAGMTDEEWQAYNRTIAEASEDARTALERRILREFTRQQTEHWRELRAPIEAQVVAEIDGDKRYQVLAAMQRGTTPAGEPLSVDEAGNPAPPLKLNKAAVIELVGQAGLDALPRPWVYAKSGGIHPNQLAELYGFSSGHELLTSIMGLPARSKAIEAEVQRRMKELYGDSLTDGTLAEQALETVYSGEGRQEVVRAELRALHGTMAATIPPGPVLRARAEEAIKGVPLMKLRPGLYLQAARRASQKAFKLLGEGDRAGAIQAKRDELVALARYQAALAARDDVARRTRWVKDHDGPKARGILGKAGQTYQATWDAILSQFGFERVTQKALARQSSVRAYVEELKAKGVPVDMPDEVLADLARTNVAELNYEEFVAVTDGLQHLYHLARFKDRLLKSKEKRTIDELGQKAAEVIAEHSRGERAKPLETGLPQEAGKRTWTSNLAWQRKFASLMRQMEGLQDNGFLWNTFVRPLNAAVDDENNRRHAAAARMEAIFSRYTAAERSQLGVRQYLEEIDGSMTRQGLLMVALNWGNTGNRQRLMSGYGWSQEQVEKMLDRLTEKDWQVVRDIADLVNSFWPDIVAKEMRVSGIAPEKVEASPFSTRFGTQPGWYFPAAYDPFTGDQSWANLQAENTKRIMQGFFTKATTRRGYTKERAEAVHGRRLWLNLDVVARHLDEVIHDLSHHEVLHDVSRLLAQSDFKTAVIDHYGHDVYKTLQQTLTDMAGGDIASIQRGERVLEWLRTGTSVAFMGWNLTTALVQPLGLTVSVVRIGPRWVLRGVRRAFADATQLENSVSFIWERSSFMRNRHRTVTREVREALNRLQPRGTWAMASVGQAVAGKTGAVAGFQAANFYNAVEQSFFWLIGRAQMVADVPTWLGAYEKALTIQGADEETAVMLADQAVRDSQGGGDIIDQIEAQRGGPALKLFTQFITYFSTLHQMGAEQASQVRVRDPWTYAKAGANMIMLYTVPMVLEELIRNAVKGGGDDDEENPLARFAWNQLAYIASTMIFFREVAGAFTGYDYRGPSGGAAFAAMNRVVTQAKQGELDEAAVRALWQSAGIMLHLPVTQTERLVRATMALQEHGVEGAAQALFGGKPE